MPLNLMKPRPWLPYVAPMFVFLVLTSLENLLVRNQGGPRAYPLYYSVKLLIMLVVVWRSRSAWKDLSPGPGPGGSILAIVLGLGVTALWIGLGERYPLLTLGGRRVGFDPTRLQPLARAAFFTLRFFGLVVLVPVVEELFWRSFLVRWLVHADFRGVAIGRVTPLAALVSSLFFAAVHPEWLPALLTGLVWVWLLWRTRSVRACVLSHAVANLSLGIYIVATGSWKFW